MLGYCRRIAHRYEWKFSIYETTYSALPPVAFGRNGNNDDGLEDPRLHSGETCPMKFSRLTPALFPAAPACRLFKLTM